MSRTIYAGIGSRCTPWQIWIIMEQLGQKLASNGAVLRSGGKRGADEAFERGCDKVVGRKIIFSPYGYNFRYRSGDKVHKETFAYTRKEGRDAERIAAEHHPNWSRLDAHCRCLHARNVHIILSLDCKSPVDFVLCWTPDGARTAEETSRSTGGTGQAIRIASNHGIKVYNLAAEKDLELANSWLSQ